MWRHAAGAMAPGCPLDTFWMQGKIRIGSKAVPSGEVQRLLAQRWLDVCLPATGFHTYEDMRQAVNTERNLQQ